MKNKTKTKNITKMQQSLSYALNIILVDFSIVVSAFSMWFWMDTTFS